MNGLDLFSGIGGLSISLSEWVRPIAYCEIDPYCQAVLLNLMGDGRIERCPIWDDIRTFDASQFPKRSLDIIFGGFPCQDISVAGRGKGLEGERSGLFFEIVRLAKEIKPKFIFLENVPAITSRGGISVTREITEMGYDCRWCVISAASVGALHRSERWFLLAHARCERLTERAEKIQSKGKEPIRKDNDELCWGKDKSDMVRKGNGIPCQLDRIRALGNAVVPSQAKEAFKILMGIE